MKIDVVYIFTTVAFFIWSIRSIFYFVDEWQRILTKGKFPKASFSYLFTFFVSPLSLITWIGVVFSIYASISDFPLEYDQYFIFVLFLTKAIFTFREISRKKLKIPSFNSQILIIISLSLLFIALAFTFPLSERYLWLLILDRLLFIFVCIPIFLVMFPSEIVDDLNIRRAVRKIKKLKKLKTVLILGDDSRETTFFIEQLIRKNKETVVVQDSFMRMSTIGRAILSDVTDQTDFIFIVYSNASLSLLESILREVPFTTIIAAKQVPAAGERVMRMVRPYVTQKTQVITDKTYEEYSNLIKNKKNIAIFDINSHSVDSSLSLQSIEQKKNKLLCKILYKDEIITFSAPLIGIYHAKYLIPAILFCLLAGIKKEDLIRNLASIIPLPGQFVEHRLQSGVTLIDATQVTDTSVIQQGLQYFKLYRKNKVIIFGIEEELTKNEIRDLMNELALSTTILVTSEKHQLLLRRLMRVGTDRVEIRTMHPSSVINFTRDRLSRDDLVLFLGEKVSPIVESILLSSSTTK